MNKLELIRAVQKKTTITAHQAVFVVQTFFDALSNGLIAGERVEIRGFCSFQVKEYETYTGRNPKTGEDVVVPSKRLPFFKCGKDLKSRVNKKKINSK